MFNKMKKMFKNEKGFTLVELLAVIVILGIITAVAVPAIGNILDNSKEDVHEANCKLIENSVRLANVGSDETVDETVTLGTLVSNEYLEELPENVGDHTYGTDETVADVCSDADTSGGGSGNDD